MPDPCQLVLDAIGAQPPYGPLGEPLSIRVQGRVTQGCQQVRVIVRAAGPSSPALADQIVPVDFSQDAQPAPLTGLFSLAVVLPPVGYTCGDTLYVEASCTDDPSCSAAGQLPIICKPAPEGPLVTGWPRTRCFWTAVGSAMTLLAALACIALGVGIQDPALLAVGTVLVATAGISWALWNYWCSPAWCTRAGVLCWVFKRGFIAALPVIFFSSSALIILVVIGYGSVAGRLVEALEEHGCLVPSAKQPVTQLPV